MVIPVGMSSKILDVYSSLSGTSRSNIKRSSGFIASYTKVTGNTSLAIAAGYSTNDVEAMLEGYSSYAELEAVASSAVSSITGSSVSAAPTSGDFMDCAKAICSKFVKSSGSYDYSQDAGSISEIEFNGKSIKTTHRDCSCLVSALRYLEDIDSNWAHRTSAIFKTFSSTGATTYGQVQVGDVLWREGHVAMIVKIEGDIVYIADAGSTDKIKKTAENGYAYTKKTTDSIGSTPEAFSKVVR